MSDFSNPIRNAERDAPTTAEPPWWYIRAESHDTPQEVLREHLAQTQKATRFILTFLYSEHTNLTQGINAANLATRLMDVSLKLAQALGGGHARENVHRMIFEHRPGPAMLEATQRVPADLAGDTPGVAEAKTIRCDVPGARYEIE